MKKHKAKRLKEKEKKVKPNKETEKKANKKADKKSAKNKHGQAENELFDFDNEIVIGVTKLTEPRDSKKKKQTQSAKKSKTKKQPKEKKQNKTSKFLNTKTKKNEQNKKIDFKKEKRKRRIKSFLKGVLITTGIVGALLAIMLSPLFNLEEIEVQGNSKITENEIKILSEINIGENIFIINNNTVINKIESNPYVEEVKITKQLPDKILIEIQERKATYALKHNGKYVYINNQGYFLEQAETPNNLTEIISYETPVEEIKLGGRLFEEDLDSLGTILKIVESANNNGLGNLITSIDMANKNDIILRIESERKNNMLWKCIRHKYQNDVYKSNN